MLKKIGFIGQGWIGKNYADWYEQNGFSIVRYSLEPPHANNKDAIAECDIVFIAVPTPTTPEKGFDDSIVRSMVGLVGTGKIALIKSTVLPGTTRSIQEQHPDKHVLFSPEFLSESTAAYDVANPDRNIVGYVSEAGRGAAQDILDIMPPAPHQALVKAEEAEMIRR
jgi:UDPglucose 6-dehydrogenase